MRHSFDVKKFLPERVGVEINNRYEIDANEFARGGYGKVYVAKERVSGQEVAIKEVLIRDPKQKEALQREAQIMKDAQSDSFLPATLSLSLVISVLLSLVPT